MTDIKVHIGPQYFSDWTAIRIKRSVTQLASEFSLNCSGKWAQGHRPQLLAGKEVKLLLGAARVLTGYVDVVQVEYDAEHHTVRIEGRSRTADLVDSSMLSPPSGWAGLKLAQIAEAVCARFKIKVVDDANAQQPIPNFIPNDGETAFECLERAARNVGVMLTTDAMGNLVLTHTASSRSLGAIVLGKNVVGATGGVDLRDRYSVYYCAFQAAEDFDVDKNTNSIVGIAPDPFMQGLGRYRPRFIHCEPVVGFGLPKIRANWEMSVRKGHSEAITYTVPGWFAKPGKLWEPNQLVHVSDPFMGIQGDRLITDVVYTYSDQPSSGGERCELTVMPPDAMAPAPQPMTPPQEVAP